MVTLGFRAFGESRRALAWPVMISALLSLVVELAVIVAVGIYR